MSLAFLDAVAHRPWPCPQDPWVFRQRWDNVLFLHFRVSKHVLARWVPAPLAVEEHAGSAWVSLVPFRMRRVRLRGLPAFAPVSDFAELNLRTYVRHGDRPGVIFLRIQAEKRLSTWLARTLSALPYEYAPMALRLHGAGASFQSPDLAVDFTAPGALRRDAPDDLDHFLTERYCMYAVAGRSVTRADVHHLPWQLAEVRARVSLNRLLEPLGVARPLFPDRVHLSPGVEVVGWPSSGWPRSP